jgi:hypothetical protein
MDIICSFLVLHSPTYLFTADVVGFLWVHLITLRHAPQSVGLLWTRDRPVTETSIWQYKHCTRQTSLPPVGFEPMIPAKARPQTYALDCAATGVGGHCFIWPILFASYCRFASHTCVWTAAGSDKHIGYIKQGLYIITRYPLFELVKGRSYIFETVFWNWSFRTWSATIKHLTTINNV